MSNVIPMPLSGQNAFGYKLYNIDDLLAHRSDPNRWIIDGLVPRVGRMMVYGDPSSYKSTIILDLVLAVASGGLFLGRSKTLIQGPAIMVSSEGDIDANKDRILDNLRMRGLQSEDIRDTFYWGQDALELNKGLGYQILRNLVMQHQPKILVVDPLASFFAGDENLQHEVSPFLQGLDNIVRQFQLCLIVLHHKNKKGNVRGSTAWAGWADTELEFEKMDQYDAPGVDISLEQVKITVRKQRNGRAGGHSIVIPLMRPGGSKMTGFAVVRGEDSSDVSRRYLALRVYGHLMSLPMMSGPQTTNQIRLALKRNHQDVHQALTDVLQPAGLVRPVGVWRSSQEGGQRGRMVDGGWAWDPPPIDVEQQLVQSALSVRTLELINGEYVDDVG